MINIPNDPSLQGGVPLQQFPVIPWNAYVACGLKVFKDDKIQSCIFAPQPMETPDEVFQVLRSLMAAQQNKPGPIAWETVPEEVQKHFAFQHQIQTE